MPWMTIFDEVNMSTQAKISLQQLLDALLDDSKPFHPRFLYRLSDLEEEEVQQITEIWPKVALRRRQALLEDIEEIGENDYLVSYAAFGRMALDDSDPKVRMTAVHLLWDYEERELVPVFLKLMERDVDEGVRAAAASALGKYIYLGEVEELPEKTLRKVEDSLLKVIGGDDTDLVRRHALESMGFSSRDEIPSLIEQAYHSGDEDWLISALFAMGRSANQQWAQPVMSMLDARRPAVRTEAARAAGELELHDALDELLEMLDDGNDEVRMASIWALSQIGGEGVREALEDLQEETNDDDETEYLDAALDNLSFTEEMGLFGMFDLPDSESQHEFDGDDLDLEEVELDEDDDYLYEVDDEVDED